MENKCRLVGTVVNKHGEYYGIWQEVRDGIIYWGVTKGHETMNFECAYRDLGYLARMKGFSI